MDSPDASTTKSPLAIEKFEGGPFMKPSNEITIRMINWNQDRSIKLPILNTTTEFQFNDENYFQLEI